MEQAKPQSQVILERGPQHSSTSRFLSQQVHLPPPAPGSSASSGQAPPLQLHGTPSSTSRGQERSSSVGSCRGTRLGVRESCASNGGGSFTVGPPPSPQTQQQGPLLRATSGSTKCAARLVAEVSRSAASSPRAALGVGNRGSPPYAPVSSSGRAGGGAGHRSASNSERMGSVRSQGGGSLVVPIVIPGCQGSPGASAGLVGGGSCTQWPQSSSAVSSPRKQAFGTPSLNVGAASSTTDSSASGCAVGSSASAAPGTGASAGGSAAAWPYCSSVPAPPPSWNTAWATTQPLVGGSVGCQPSQPSQPPPIPQPPRGSTAATSASQPPATWPSPPPPGRTRTEETDKENVLPEYVQASAKKPWPVSATQSLPVNLNQLQQQQQQQLLQQQIPTWASPRVSANPHASGTPRQQQRKFQQPMRQSSLVPLAASPELAPPVPAMSAKKGSDSLKSLKQASSSLCIGDELERQLQLRFPDDAPHFERLAMGRFRYSGQQIKLKILRRCLYATVALGEDIPLETFLNNMRAGGGGGGVGACGAEGSCGRGPANLPGSGVQPVSLPPGGGHARVSSVSGSCFGGHSATPSYSSAVNFSGSGGHSATPSYSSAVNFPASCSAAASCGSFNCQVATTCDGGTSVGGASLGGVSGGVNGSSSGGGGLGTQPSLWRIQTSPV
eukprot:TRINITY_DN13433_c0_g3_i1.p1 TRINITY_DN13433_c0_g3~~TRINITY_DN13433_c0_g3_i1.p1  ORF type:complete len:681 (+),score=127.28 TRINITY_DN13433_c0_g3_i1:34-2043(+)